jgi:hypothetical protein
MSERAQVIDRRYTKQCDICMLIDTDKPDMKWHAYKEGLTEDEDGYVCDNCLTGVKEIRKKCHQKIDNPSHKILDDFTPWFINEVPGLAAEFKKEKF